MMGESGLQILTAIIICDRKYGSVIINQSDISKNPFSRIYIVSKISSYLPKKLLPRYQLILVVEIILQ